MLGRWWGEKTTLREWLALLLGFGGVGILAWGDELRADAFSAAVLFCAPISWAWGSILSRKLPLAAGMMSAATQMLTGGALLALVSAMAGETVPAVIPSASLWAWAYLAVFGSLIAYSAFMYLLRNTRPAVATSYSYVNPVIAVLVGVGVGGETAGAGLWWAVVCIVLATVVVMVMVKPTPSK